MHQYRNVPQLDMGLDELVVDNFAGGGGASTGIEAALGRPVDVAINHDPDAIAMHTINHPTTKHYCESVWEVDPRKVVGSPTRLYSGQGRPVSVAWFSPDCTHFSRAKGGTPVKKEIRGLAWVAVKWAATVRPRMIFLENVEEFMGWGPVVDGKACPRRKRKTFDSFVNALRHHGYKVEWKVLRACDYGVPTIRKRFFLIARCDGQPIVWPKPTHGDPKKGGLRKKRLKPWVPASKIIDWSIPCPSIFQRKRPLAEATQRRIARGMEKYVFNNPKPFIVRIGQQGAGDGLSYDTDQPLTTITSKNEHCLITPYITTCNHGGEGFRGQSLEEPTKTITAAHDAHGVIAPVLIQTGYGERPGQDPRALDLQAPLGTVVGQGTKHALVMGFMAKHFGGGYNGPGYPLTDPVHTVTGIDHNALVTSHLINLKRNCYGTSQDDPIPTVTAGGTHVGEVRAFLMKYYSEGGQWASLDDPLHTILGKDRLGLVTVEGTDYQIVDIGMRMLEPHELAAAHNFPSNYIINRYADGSPVAKYKQVARIGNSVPPTMAEVLVRANTTPAAARKRAAA